MNNNTILMSPADSNIYNYFAKQYNIINSDILYDYISFEQQHADMQALKIKDTLFINSCAKGVTEALDKADIEYIICDGICGNYPHNVALNAALVGNKLLCKESALHKKVTIFCKENDIEIINVKQGYAKCSCIVVDDNSIITDDESIAKASLINNINVLKINRGNIILDEDNVGFIGGASAKIGDCVYFFGDISNHTNHKEIVSFITTRGLQVKSVGNGRLQDIGGIVEI